MVIRFKINFGVRSIDVARLAVESRVKEGEEKAAWISDITKWTEVGFTEWSQLQGSISLLGPL